MSPPPRSRAPAPPRRWERGLVGRAVRFATHDAWHAELGALPTFRRHWLRAYRIVHIAIRGFFRDRCSQRAAVLTYITIFSLPALLIFAFAIAKGFGAYDKLQTEVIDPFLDRTFGNRTAAASQEGVEQIREVIDTIFQAVEKTDLKALGSVGFVLLIYSAIKMLAAVEHALNSIWGIRRARTLVRRVTDYLSIVVVAPILLIVGSALTVYLRSERFAAVVGDVGIVLRPVLGMLPVVSVWLGLTFVLLTMPNKRGQLSSAVLGGIVAGLGWQLVQVLYVEFQVGIARMQPIYASFVAMPLFLIWIYLSWNTLLAGAEVACAHENEHLYTSIARTGEVDQRYREALAPRLAGRIAAAFLAGEPPPAAPALATALSVAPRTALEVLDALEAHDLLVRTGEDRGEGYLPARDPETITVLDLLHALRTTPGTANPPVRARLDARVDRILAAFDETLGASLPNYTLRELARTHLEPAVAPEDARDAAPARPADEPA
ncbi:MAG: YihY/virulence factor BrkB family protein [Planctomycetota bacterium]